MMGVELETVLVLYCSYLTCQIEIMVYDLV